ncbi:MAG: dTDP-4-dehydrorhamnose reductase [Gammaproteobacteria bacterium]|nr:dTDP-4-dehydrorhamnose reductase [Gammaproteobacteria bacterium]
MHRNHQNILLFGASGQLGTKLKTLLTSRGVVRPLDQKDIDLRDHARLRALIHETRPALIVNAAAYTAVDAAENDAETARLVNAGAPQVMAECARELGALLVHYSTDYVFDGTAQAPYTEGAPTRPLGVYGHTKLAGETAIAESGADFLTLRTAWLYSNRGKNFLNTMLKLAAERSELRVVNDQVGCPTYADHLAETTLQMLEGLYTDGVLRKERCGLYHVTCGGSTSWWGFAQRIVELAGYGERVRVLPIPTSEYPTPAKRPGYSVLSNAKLEATFGIHMPDWEAGLKRCLADRSRGG